MESKIKTKQTHTQKKDIQKEVHSSIEYHFVRKKTQHKNLTKKQLIRFNQQQKSQVYQMTKLKKNRNKNH